MGWHPDAYHLLEGVSGRPMPIRKEGFVEPFESSRPMLMVAWLYSASPAFLDHCKISIHWHVGMARDRRIKFHFNVVVIGCAFSECQKIFVVALEKTIIHEGV